MKKSLPYTVLLYVGIESYVPVVIKKECLLEFVDLVFAELDPASAAGRTMTRSGHFDTTKTYKIKGKFYTYTTVLYRVQAS